MTQTETQHRPDGHAEDCPCSTCRILRKAWPDPATEPTPAFDLAWHSNDYLKRIHWWVRLFGIVWIVIPVMAMLAGIGLLLAGVGLSAANRTPSAYEQCVSRGTVSASECASIYGR